MRGVAEPKGIEAIPRFHIKRMGRTPLPMTDLGYCYPAEWLLDIYASAHATAVLPPNVKFTPYTPFKPSNEFSPDTAAIARSVERAGYMLCAVITATVLLVALWKF